ncbi:MAG: O-antigen ligase family protein [Actinomycetota bacterium]
MIRSGPALALAGLWSAVVLGWAVSGWSLWALLVCVPGLVAATLVASPDAGPHRVGLQVAAATLGFVLALSPPALGVAAIFDPGPGAWWFRIAALGPMALLVLSSVPPRRPSTPTGLLAAAALWGLAVAVLTPLPAESALAAVELLVVIVLADRLIASLGGADVLVAVGAGLTTFALASLATWAFDGSPARLPGFDEDTRLGVPRLADLSTEPIQLAEAVAPLVLLGLAAIVGLLPGRGVGVAMFAVGLVTAGATQSRAALGAVLAAGLWMLLRTKGQTALAALVVAGAALTTMVGLSGIGAGPLDDLAGLRQDGGSGADLRVTEIWPAAVDRAIDRPVQGWGLAGTEVAMQRSMDDGDLRPIVFRNTHNRALELVVALGVVGAALVVAAVGSAIAALARRPAPLIEALIVYVALVGLTGPGSGSQFTGIDELLLIVAVVVATSGLSSEPAQTAVRRRLPVPG